MAIPSLNIGGGKWATKQDKLLAYKQNIGGRYFAINGDTSRNSTATFTNQNGLIDSVGNNVARVDFQDDVKGSLLLEPQSTNLLSYSEDFSNANWTKTNSSITLNSVVSPDGTQNASTLNFTSGANSNINNNVSVTVGQDYTISVWLKSTIGNQTRRFGASEGNASLYIDVDITDEWQRFEVLISSYAFTGLTTRISNANDNSIAGSVLVWGAQLEQLPYATSYIPTSGSAVTRVQDVANSFGDVNTFNSSELTIIIDFIHLQELYTSETYIYSLGSDSDNAIWLRKESGTDSLTFRIRTLGVNQVTLSGLNIVSGLSKMAFKCKNGDISIWYNGNEINTSLASMTLPLSNIFNFNLFGSQISNNKVKQVQVYKEALTDAQLITLTTI